MSELQFSTDWFTGNIPVWKQYLSQFNGKQQLRYLEVGSWEGRSACWLLENVLTDPSSHLTCIDTFAGNPESNAAPRDQIPFAEARFDANIAAIGATAQVTKLKGKSQEILRSLPLASFDFLYIDGSHVAVDVLTDAVLGWGLLVPGGMLIFDDYGWKGNLERRRRPRRAIDAFLKVFADQYEVLHKGWQVILRKI